MPNYVRLVELAEAGVQAASRELGLFKGMDDAVLAKELAQAKLSNEAFERTTASASGGMKDTNVRSKALSEYVNSEELAGTMKKLRIGEIFWGSSPVDTLPTAVRTKQGIELSVPQDHDIEFGLFNDHAYASKVTLLKDNSAIWENPKGFRYPDGSRKLHIGDNGEAEHFVKSLDVENGFTRGIYSADSHLEERHTYDALTAKGEGAATVREIYGVPTSVYPGHEDDYNAQIHNVIEVIRDHRAQTETYKILHPEHGLIEQHFDLRKTNPSSFP